MSRPLTTAVTTGFAVFFLLAGAILVFAPAETAAFLFGAAAGSPLAYSLLGAALFGIGLLDWTARHSLLGGIYGRAVVVGNAVHLLVGALALIRFAAAGEAHPALWAVAAVYTGGAVFFGSLMFSAPALPAD